MNILSVDWDYFFPCMDNYDWCHSERSFMLDLIWSTRVGAFDLLTKQKAIETLVPKDYEEFWAKMRFAFPQQLIIAETHVDLYHILSGCVSVSIWNFDAHHDLGYENDNRRLNCGNWANHLLKEERMGEYHVIYPSWRKEFPETKNEYMSINNTMRRVEIHHEIPKLPLFNVIFICRSSAWTPPWRDNCWMKFINWWKRNREHAWKEKRFSEFVLKARGLTLKKAVAERAQRIKDFDLLEKLNTDQPALKAI